MGGPLDYSDKEMTLIPNKSTGAAAAGGAVPRRVIRPIHYGRMPDQKRERIAREASVTVAPYYLFLKELRESSS